jgi:hypothetical protein
VFTTVVFWTIWKFRNELCFQGRKWAGMRVLPRSMCKNAKRLDAASTTEGRDDPEKLGGETTSFALGPCFIGARPSDSGTAEILTYLNSSISNVCNGWINDGRKNSVCTTRCFE